MKARARRLPVTAMTAGAMEDDRERCLASGMDDYVSKPVDPRKLEAALERWVPGAGPAAGAPSPLDLARLEVLRGMGGGDGEVLARMAEAFVAHTPPDLAALDGALAGGDSVAVVQVAHPSGGRPPTWAPPPWRRHAPRSKTSAVPATSTCLPTSSSPWAPSSPGWLSPRPSS